MYIKIIQLCITTNGSPIKPCLQQKLIATDESTTFSKHELNTNTTIKTRTEILNDNIIQIKN